jgi:hypothetical protein
MTTATTWRKERGRETERLLAAYWRERGWPYAEPVGAGRPGADITGMPGLAPEVKAVKSFSPQRWLRQARTHDGTPFVVYRPDGLGPVTIGRWPVILELDEFTRLLRAAGYGDGDDS